MMRKRASNNKCRFLTPDPSESTHYSDFELSESDVWTGSTRSDSFESCPPPPAPVSRRQSTAARSRSTVEPKSVPVNVPDWSKILREECRSRERKSNGVYFNGDDVDDDVAVGPPHEYLATRTRSTVEPKSVPINVPDWSKILREECRDRERKSNSVYFNGDDDVDGDVVVVPPHEYLAKIRRESMLVQEGFGWTLKGRDLSQLRNAIWEITTGFQD